MWLCKLSSPHVEVSTEVHTCQNISCILQWLSQQPMMIGLWYLNRLPETNESICSIKIYLHPGKLFRSFDDYCLQQTQGQYRFVCDIEESGKQVPVASDRCTMLGRDPDCSSSCLRVSPDPSSENHPLSSLPACTKPGDDALHSHMWLNTTTTIKPEWTHAFVQLHQRWQQPNRWQKVLLIACHPKTSVEDTQEMYQ